MVTMLIIIGATLLFSFCNFILKEEDIDLLYVTDEESASEVVEQLVATSDYSEGDQQTVLSYEESQHASVDIDALANEYLTEEHNKQQAKAAGINERQGRSTIGRRPVADSGL